jgi:hypothetical protein
MLVDKKVARKVVTKAVLMALLTVSWMEVLMAAM